MQKTFANLPLAIEDSIGTILSHEDTAVLTSSSEQLHERYLKREKGKEEFYLNSFSDALSYLALRFPATYAQIFSAFAAIQEVIPSWSPHTLLDIGSGPGTGILAASEIWPNITEATCIDVNKSLIQFGQKIIDDVKLPIEVIWKYKDVRNGIEDKKTYDVVLLSSVLNELNVDEREELLIEAFNLCSGVMIIIEPGTQYGNTLVQSVAKKFADSAYLIAPYLNNSFVTSDDYWLHFPQRFIRPDFQRRIRQHLRENMLMASDWEEAKYSYVAISKLPLEDSSWGRCIGHVKKQKGFLEVPILTKNNIMQVKVMKRHKKQYTFAKDLKWGQLIPKEEDIIITD